MRFYVKESPVGEKAFSSPQAVAESFKDLTKADQESFWILGLNNKNRILLKECLSLGCMGSAPVDLRILFKRTIVKGCAGLIVAHNHPSGEKCPSSEDKILTDKIKQASNLLGISFLDHLIIADDGYFSFKESGIL